MKKLISIIVTLCLCICLSLIVCSCSSKSTEKQKIEQYIETADRYSYYLPFDNITYGMTISEIQEQLTIKADNFNQSTDIDYAEQFSNTNIECVSYYSNLSYKEKPAKITFSFLNCKDSNAISEPILFDIVVELETPIPIKDNFDFYDKMLTTAPLDYKFSSMDAILTTYKNNKTIRNADSATIKNTALESMRKLFGELYEYRDKQEKDSQAVLNLPDTEENKLEKSKAKVTINALDTMLLLDKVQYWSDDKENISSFRFNGTAAAVLVYADVNSLKD